MSLAVQNVVAQVVIDETYSPIDLENVSPLQNEILETVVGDEVWVYAQRLIGIDENQIDALNSTEVEWTSEPATAVEFLEEEKYYTDTDTDEDYVVLGVLVRFLEPGRVGISAAGYTNGTVPPADDGLTAEFEFEVVSADDGGESASDGLTANQRTAQTELFDTCDANRDGDDFFSVELQNTCDELALLDDPAAALDAIVPDELFSIGDMLVITADQQLNNVEARINTVRAGQRRAFDVSGMNLTLGDQRIPGVILSEIASAASFSGGGASTDDVASNFENSNIGVFVNGNVSIGTLDGDNIQADADFSTSVLTLGADYRLGSDRVIGAAFSIESDNTDFAADDGELDMQGFGLTAFGTWYEQDRAHADVIFSISRNQFDINRRINLPGNEDEFAEGSSDATRLSVAINVGRTLQRGATEFGPLAAMSITRASVGGFTETSSLAGNGPSANGAGTALNVDSQSITSARVALGGELKHVINTSKAVLVPYSKLFLDFESQTEKEAISVSFVNDVTATKMRFNGAKRDASSLLFSLGTTAVFIGNQSAFISLDTRLLDERVRQTQIRLGYRTQF